MYSLRLSSVNLHRAGQRVDRGAPLGLGELVLAHEAVQVAGQADQQRRACAPTARSWQ